VATDQPFTLVEEPEFGELLQYVHKHTGRVLEIPKEKSVKGKIMKMGDELEKELTAMFAVRVFTNRQRKRRLTRYRKMNTSLLCPLTPGHRAMDMRSSQWFCTGLITQAIWVRLQFTHCFWWLISLHCAEECLIDFAELIGSHSGENMADTVWATLEKFGLCERVRHLTPVRRNC
jgi:hypothetical protein